VVGYNENIAGQKAAAEAVMAILPKCEHSFLVAIESVELFKYAHNLNGYFRVILANLLHDVGAAVGANWDEVSAIMDKDVMRAVYSIKCPAVSLETLDELSTIAFHFLLQKLLPILKHYPFKIIFSI
jgi:hypothetical protein